MQQVAMGWLTYRLTGSAWLLGVVAFCGSAGIVAFGAFAGVVADHVHRRRALRITQSLALLQALVLAALTWSGHIAVWHLIVLALWLGMVAAFDVPLRQSLWVHLVEDRADLPNAIALNSFLVNAARVIGPGDRGTAARRRQRSRLLRAQRVVLRRRDRRDRTHALGAGGAAAGVARRLLVELGGGLPLRVRLRAGEGDAGAGRRPVVDGQPVFVADAGLREGHLRRRSPDAGLPARGRRRRRARQHALSREPRDGAGSGARDRRRGDDVRTRADGLRVPRRPAAGAGADGGAWAAASCWRRRR